MRPDENIEYVVSSFYDKIGSPVLEEVALEFGQVHAEEIFPTPLPDLFAGNQLLVLGAASTGGELASTFRGLVNGEPIGYTFHEVHFQKEGERNPFRACGPRARFDLS